MRTAKHGIWPQMGRSVCCCLLNVLKLIQSVHGVSGCDRRDDSLNKISVTKISGGDYA
jgi:hypothetical protein